MARAKTRKLTEAEKSMVLSAWAECIDTWFAVFRVQDIGLSLVSANPWRGNGIDELALALDSWLVKGEVIDDP
jgi:hypothetical protein